MAWEVSCKADSVSLWIRQSKTDQSGRGMQIQIFSIQGSSICLVNAVQSGHFLQYTQPWKGRSLCMWKGWHCLSSSTFLFLGNALWQIIFSAFCLSLLSHWDCVLSTSFFFLVYYLFVFCYFSLQVAMCSLFGFWDIHTFSGGLG